MKRSGLLKCCFLGMFAVCLFCGTLIAEGHEGHKAMMQAATYKRTILEYPIPNVTLRDQNNQEINLQQYLAGRKPVVLDFIFSTCTTVCPVLSATFANFQKELAPDHENVHLVSISIDPDNDTPEVLKKYLAQFGAQSGWDILTGKKMDIETVRKKFDSFVANKMDHVPVTLMRSPGSKQWVRLEGLLSAAELRMEYDKMMAH